MKKLINFQVNWLFKYWQRNLDKYPKIKKNKKDAKVAPNPKYILSMYKKFFEKFPKKKTVSE